MASTVPQEVIDKITKTKGTLASAKLYIETSEARRQAAIAAAIEEALALGATAEQLAPVKLAAEEMEVDADKVAAAIAANP